MHVPSLFLISNDKAIRKNDKVHAGKLQKLIPNIHEISIIDNVLHDPNNVIYNFSDYNLTDSDKLLLMRGLSFAIPAKKIECSKFLFQFKFLFRDIKPTSEFSIELTSINAHLQDKALTSYSAFDKDTSPPFILSKDELESLCKLKNENNLVVQKADEGDTTVILDKDSSLKSAETLLKDFSKLKTIPVVPDPVVPDKDLNYVINSVTRANDHPKKA